MVPVQSSPVLHKSTGAQKEQDGAKNKKKRVETDSDGDPRDLLYRLSVTLLSCLTLLGVNKHGTLTECG